MLFSVRLYDASLARSHANPKKIYCVDHALIASAASGILVNSGHRFENLIFAGLRRCCPEIHYYRTKTGRQVDFLVPGRASLRGSASHAVGGPAEGRSKILVQACESSVHPQTRKREVAALAEAMAELKIRTGTIVARDESEQIAVDGGRIDVVPAWRFLLDLPESSG